MRLLSGTLSFVVALALSLSGGARAQSVADTVGAVPGIEVETSVDVAEIFIGDLITYTVAITYDSTYELVPPPLGANLGTFDVKDYEPDKTSTLPDGRIRSETVFKLTTFTTGDYIIPPMPLAFTLPDSSRKVILADPIPITVKSMLAEAGDSVDIKPLKPQHEFEREFNPLYLWGGLALLAIIAGMVIWIVIRRSRAEGEPVDLRPPWEIAFEKLALLKERNLIDSESYKQYYFELTDIAREYLGRVYRTDVMEMTTEEFVDRFAEMRMPGELFGQLTDFLRHADLVKFAKYLPERQQTESDFEFVHDMIGSVRTDFEQRQVSDTRVSDVPSAEPPVIEREAS